MPIRAANILSGALAVYLVAPLIVILPVALTDQRFLSLPEDGLSTAHFARFFGDEFWISAALQSLVIGVAAATLAGVLGFLAAAAVWLSEGRFGRIVAMLAVMPMVLPSIVLALGLYRLFVPVGLLDTYLGVVLGHAIGALPYAFILSLAGLSALPPVLFHAARSLGARPVVALFGVVLPSVKGAAIAGWIFAFLHSWDELVVTLFISSRSVTTLPRMMWDGLNENLDPIIAAIAVMLVVLSSLLLVIVNRATGRDRP